MPRLTLYRWAFPVMAICAIGPLSAQPCWEWASPAPGGNTLHGLFFSDKNHGTVVGGRGMIMSTSDGGAHWTYTWSGTFSDLQEVHYLDRQNGVIVGAGGTVLWTSDGGQSWTNRWYSGNNSLNGVVMTGPAEAYIVGGNGCILHTTDQGSSSDVQA